MAWRIHDSVIRGEIENEQRGLVTGRLWLAGLKHPVVLALKGNAWPDLAGCRLTFVNSGKPEPLRDPESFNLRQEGAIGDLTASRKVRVFDLPLKEALERLRQKLPVSEHLANSLYLEWYSEANGRVVVESADYHLTISPPLWRLTPAEEEQRQKDAAAGMAGFMKKMTEALEAARHQPPEDKELDEFDYEKLLRESDARANKLAELFDKYLDHPDRDHIIAQEMGWTGLDQRLAEEKNHVAPKEFDRESDDTGETDEDPYAEDAETEELTPDPTTEGVDWIKDPEFGIEHPLCLRGLKAVLAFQDQCKAAGADIDHEPDLVDLSVEFQVTTAKLAGALNGLPYGRELEEGPFIVACLKRALAHLQKAQAALERVATKNLLPPDLVKTTRTELFQIREEILRLMKEFRGGK
jgi:hypothetical protein